MYWRKNILAIIIIFLLFLFSSLLLIIEAKKVITIIMYIIASFMIIMGISFLISARQYRGNDKKILIIQSIFLILFSTITFIFPSALMRTILGALFIIIPLIKMLFVEDKFKQFIKDIYKYIIGLILLLSFDSVLDIAVKTLGVLLFALGIILLVILIKNRHQNTNILYKLMIKLLLKKG
ncbi:MAG TPA: hypothetical protein VIK94_01575 [Bacilli bacterium]